MKSLSTTKAWLQALGGMRKMEIKIEELLPQVVEVLWNAVGAEKSIGGINIKQLTKQLCLALSEGRYKDQEDRVAETSANELKRIISDLMKLRKIALKMQPKERKVLFYALLLTLAAAVLESEAVEKIWKIVTRNG
jgi:hypothetical protein